MTTIINYNIQDKTNLEEWIKTIDELGKKKNEISKKKIEDILALITHTPTNISFSKDTNTYEGEEFNNLLNTIRDLKALETLIPVSNKPLKDRITQIYSDLNTDSNLYDLAVKKKNYTSFYWYFHTKY